MVTLQDKGASLKIPSCGRGVIIDSETLWRAIPPPGQENLVTFVPLACKGLDFLRPSENGNQHHRTLGHAGHSGPWASHL